MKDCARVISLLLSTNPGAPIKKISGDEEGNLLKWLNHQNGNNWKAFLGGFYLSSALQDFSFLDVFPGLLFLKPFFSKSARQNLFAHSWKFINVNLSSRLSTHTRPLRNSVWPSEIHWGNFRFTWTRLPFSNFFYFRHLSLTLQANSRGAGQKGRVSLIHWPPSLKKEHYVVLSGWNIHQEKERTTFTDFLNSPNDQTLLLLMSE